MALCRPSINTAGRHRLPGGARHPPGAVEYVAMSDAEQGSPGDSGIFGNLPSSRPGTRSPRRSKGDAAPEQRAKAKPPEERKGKATSAASAPGPEQPPPRPRAGDPRPSDRREPEPPADDGQTGIEDLAWAGVAAAAEAATLGVRLATRALETVRRAAERP